MKSIRRRLLESIADTFVAPWLGTLLWRKKGTPQVLFVLSHVRSGSTLLQHVLCNHPSVVGFGENKTSYESEADIVRLLARTMVQLHSSGFSERYIVDKLVWNYVIGAEFLRSERCRFVFLLRSPQATFASMARAWNYWRIPDNASRYYVRRLAFLLDIAQEIRSRRRTFFLTYDQLTNKSSTALVALQTFLDLDEPLSERYELLPTTGQWEYGDKSANIYAGRILSRSVAPNDLPNVPDAARKAYSRSATALQALCTTPCEMG